MERHILKKVKKEEYTNKRILYGSLLILLVIFIIGVVLINILNKNQDINRYSFPNPEEVVRQYFTAWNNKDYVNMYATISDGFKKIEPSAKDLTAFVNYAKSQRIKNVNILNIKEKNNDGTTAIVDYNVELILENNEKIKFDGSFTLKFREGDIIQGWKLIHPYGDKIDTN